MDRRAFFLGLVGVAATGAALAGGATVAEAAPMTPIRPDAADEATRLESDYRPDVDGEAKTEDAQFVYVYRRPRRVYYVRRRPVVRRRVVYYRRPVRRVYYRRPVRRVYRRVYW